jgi:hypothetical protein
MYKIWQCIDCLHLTSTPALGGLDALIEASAWLKRQVCCFIVQDEADSSTGSLRRCLPTPAPVSMGISIWGILKSAIGKDLTKLTLPATVNEPLSALQRLAEDMEQVDFLDKAQKAQSAASRMLWVALYAATPVNSAILRYRKPFNPLLGETFEWLSRDSRHRFLAEQVSHHPPVACVYAQGPGYSVLGEMQLVSSFWGKAITMKNEGGITAELTGTKEKYSWKKPTFTINSIILGNPWIEATGTTSISCSNGASCTRFTFVARISCFRITNFLHDHRICMEL